MPEKFRGRFRVPTSRARWWDYGNGSYFITICTKNRNHFFGEIIDGKFYPSKIGEIAKSIWRKIPEKFKHAELGESIIMPDHMHGIINISGSLHESSDLETTKLDDPIVETSDMETETSDCPVVEPSDKETETLDCPVVGTVVKTRFIASQNPHNPENHSDKISKSKKGGITGIHNPMLHKNLSRMLRWYTGRVSFEAHKINPDFDWHGRFDDRIIRNANEYRIKTRYIQQNPANWGKDESY